MMGKPQALSHWRGLSLFSAHMLLGRAAGPGVSAWLSDGVPQWFGAIFTNCIDVCIVDFRWYSQIIDIWHVLICITMILHVWPIPNGTETGTNTGRPRVGMDVLCIHHSPSSEASTSRSRQATPSRYQVCNSQHDIKKNTHILPR